MKRIMIQRHVIDSVAYTRETGRRRQKTLLIRTGGNQRWKTIFDLLQICQNACFSSFDEIYFGSDSCLAPSGGWLQCSAARTAHWSSTRHPTTRKPNSCSSCSEPLKAPRLLVLNNCLSDGSYPYCPACYWFGILCPRFSVWFNKCSVMLCLTTSCVDRFGKHIQFNTGTKIS